MKDYWDRTLSPRRLWERYVGMRMTLPCGIHKGPRTKAWTTQPVRYRVVVLEPGEIGCAPCDALEGVDPRWPDWLIYMKQHNGALPPEWVEQGFSLRREIARRICSDPE